MQILLASQTLYNDLQQRHMARPEVDVEGPVMRIELKGLAFRVARRRLGDKVVETAIGPDSEETQSRVKHIERQHP